MKRKHDVLTHDEGAAGMIAEHCSPARNKSGRQLRGEDLVTESVTLFAFALPAARSGSLMSPSARAGSSILVRKAGV